VLRDKSLIPLSHQHQHALALCVRIERASPIRSLDIAAWQSEIALLARSEIRIHFDAEERLIFPLANRYESLCMLVKDLISDHASLRTRFASAEEGKMSAEDLSSFATLLSSHIRKEERQLFERLQELLSKEELEHLGCELERALKDADDTCILPTEATRLRGKDEKHSKSS
jgi:hemerythrin-like domain-containing protein